MNDHRFTLADAALTARPSGALWWAEAGMLVVSDLHLGKSDRIARREGRMLPPFETLETLSKLEAEIDALRPTTVLCLGDSFDDPAAAAAMDGMMLDRLSLLQAGRRWIWLEGNHDPGPVGLGGTHLAELAEGPLTFRHIARHDTPAGEVSGHYHPKISLPRAGAAHRCFLIDRRRVIMPAFGAYTGGLRTTDPALQALMGGDAIAVLLTKRAAIPAPMRPRA